MATVSNELATPPADATAATWAKFLAAKGYAKSTAKKPVPNYKSFHGYWVPPRLGSAGGTTRSSGAKRSRNRIDLKPYKPGALALLLAQKPAVFKALPAAMKEAQVIHADHQRHGATREKRKTLEVTIAELVDNGLLTAAEAAKKLGAWDKANGLT